MKYLSAQDLEDQTTISRRTWLYWAKLGRVPSYKIGSRVLFKESEIKKVIELGVSESVVSDRTIEAMVEALLKKAENNWRKSDKRKRAKEEKERRDKEDGVTAKRHPENKG